MSEPSTVARYGVSTVPSTASGIAIGLLKAVLRPLQTWHVTFKRSDARYNFDLIQGLHEFRFLLATSPKVSWPSFDPANMRACRSDESSHPMVDCSRSSLHLICRGHMRASNVLHPLVARYPLPEV